jgi:mono/diheme cytochrome c family protein
MLKAILVVTTVLAAGPALAQGAMQPFYGGQIGLSGDLHVEFAVRDGALRAWVRDHADKPVAAAGKATLLANSQKIEVVFTPDGAGLIAKAPISSGDKLVAVLALSAAGKAVSARFAQEAVVTPALAGAALAGKPVFDKVCAECHGTALRGSDSGPPLLHNWYAPNSGHDDKQVLKTINNGTQGHMWKFGDMPRPEGLKPGQDVETLAYVRAMQAANGIDGGAAAAMGKGGHAHH